MPLQHLRYTARLLARSPAFTLSAILCLGLGIGVTSSLFSIFNTLLWKPLPVADPGALVRSSRFGKEAMVFEDGAWKLDAKGAQ